MDDNESLLMYLEKQIEEMRYYRQRCELYDDYDHGYYDGLELGIEYLQDAISNLRRIVKYQNIEATINRTIAVSDKQIPLL